VTYTSWDDGKFAHVHSLSLYCVSYVVIQAALTFMLKKKKKKIKKNKNKDLAAKCVAGTNIRPTRRIFDYFSYLLF